jgi:hypothetical protein
MTEDFGEFEGYRSVYAQALIQLRKDLQSPIQQFFFSEYGTKTPKPYDWHQIIGSHLAALERDRHGINPKLFVPSLTTAVRFWMIGLLPKLAMCGDERSNAVQYEVNVAISLRLDSIYGQGDPLLAAVSADAFPETVTSLTRNIGLNLGKIEEIEGLIFDLATPLAKKAWNLFQLEHTPAKISMFRPGKEFVDIDDRQYYR